jgi:hypothetical protein
MSRPRPRTEAELVEFVRAIDVPAPESLHRRVEALVAGRSSTGRSSASPARGGRFSIPRRIAAVGALAAVLAVAIAVTVGGGHGSGLSAHDTWAFTLRPATAPAPAEDKRHEGQLRAAVDGVAFPYWEDHFGWRATGVRTDRADGRTVTTVFYADRRGRRIGYAIVAGRPEAAPKSGALFWRHGVPFRVYTDNNTTVVTWLRRGHLCVVSGRGVSAATLLKLTSWHERATVAS